MKTTTTQLDWREGRRQRAWELKQAGWKQQDIAPALGMTPGAVSQWLKRGREQGVDGLRRHPVPGRQPRLSTEQRAQRPALVERGPEAYGFRGQVWTCKRVAEIIRRMFSVRHLPPSARQSALACRTAPRAAPGRAGSAAQRGRHPGLVAAALALPTKKATDEECTVVWVDQSGF